MHVKHYESIDQTYNVNDTKLAALSLEPDVHIEKGVFSRKYANKYPSFQWMPFVKENILKR